jgi:hypothetical protein
VTSAIEHWRPKGASLTLDVALHLAEAEAVKNHMTLSDFQKPWFWYHHWDSGDYVWSFHFEGNVPALGNDFLVDVHDRTRHVEFVHGY